MKKLFVAVAIGLTSIGSVHARLGDDVEAIKKRYVGVKMGAEFEGELGKTQNFAYKYNSPERKHLEIWVRMVVVDAVCVKVSYYQKSSLGVEGFKPAEIAYLKKLNKVTQVEGEVREKVLILQSQAYKKATFECALEDAAKKFRGL